MELSPAAVVAAGLGHPEGPDLLPDGRVVLANGYRSELAVWDPRTGGVARHAHTGGAPNACVRAADDSLYVTQCGRLGAWEPSDPRPPSIQRVAPDGAVEVVCTEVAGIALTAPNDLVFGADGRLWFTDAGDWDEVARPDAGWLFAIDASGRGELIAELDHAYPNGIVAEPDGAIVWVESYTREVWRRRPDASRERLCTLPEGHVPDGLKRDVLGRLWITSTTSGGIDVVTPDGRIAAFVPAGTTPSNCVFAGTTLLVADYGPLDAAGPAPLTGCLLSLEAGVEGAPPLRGSAEHGFASPTTEP